VVSDHDLRIPASSNKKGVDTTTKWGCKYVSNLEANQERICHNNGSKSSVTIIWGVGLKKIQVSKEGACITDEEGTEGEYRPYKTVLPVVSKFHINQ
jgi:hypothetical protein